MKGKILDFLVASITILSLIFLALNYREEWKDLKRRKEIQQLAKKNDLGGTEKKEKRIQEYQSPIDFDSLCKMNPDTVAWLIIPGTRIDIPVVQAEDNEIYCKANFDRKKSRKGAIFLDCDSPGDLMGRHSILYGHHMKNGSMFAEISKFLKPEFFKEHRTLILYTPERELHLKTIAAVCTDDKANGRKMDFSSLKELQKYIEEETKSCKFRELPKETIKQLYSFVTCSYEFPGARTILYAVIES